MITVSVWNPPRPKNHNGSEVTQWILYYSSIKTSQNVQDMI